MGVVEMGGYVTAQLVCSQVKCMMNLVMGPYVSTMLYLNRSTCFEDLN